MTISRSKAGFLYRRLANAEDVIVDALAKTPKAKVELIEDIVSFQDPPEVFKRHEARVDTEVSLNVVKRSQLHDLMTMLQEVLKECAGDKDFD